MKCWGQTISRYTLNNTSASKVIRVTVTPMEPKLSCCNPASNIRVDDYCQLWVPDQYTEYLMDSSHESVTRITSESSLVDRSEEYKRVNMPNFAEEAWNN